MSINPNSMSGANSIDNTIFKNPVLWVAEDSFALTNERQPGTEFIFSLRDKELIAPYRWNMEKLGYVRTKVLAKILRAHILILGEKDGFIVDHINRNRADNRRENLRHISYRENAINSNKCDIKLANNFLGVVKKQGSYEAHVHIGNRKRLVKTFKDPLIAALCYDSWILNNFIDCTTNYSSGKYPKDFLLQHKIFCEQDIRALRYEITGCVKHKTNFIGTVRKNSWGWRIRLRGREYSKFGFKTELEAAQDREQWLIQHPDCKTKRNFPDE